MVTLKELEIYKIDGKLKLSGGLQGKRKLDRTGLGTEFGSKKKKKEISSRHLNSIKSISQDSLEISQNISVKENSTVEIKSFLLLNKVNLIKI